MTVVAVSPFDGDRGTAKKASSQHYRCRRRRRRRMGQHRYLHLSALQARRPPKRHGQMGSRTDLNIAIDSSPDSDRAEESVGAPSDQSVSPARNQLRRPRSAAATLPIAKGRSPQSDRQWIRLLRSERGFGRCVGGVQTGASAVSGWMLG